MNINNIVGILYSICFWFSGLFALFLLSGGAMYPAVIMLVWWFFLASCEQYVAQMVHNP